MRVLPFFSRVCLSQRRGVGLNPQYLCRNGMSSYACSRTSRNTGCHRRGTQCRWRPRGPWCPPFRHKGKPGRCTPCTALLGEYVPLWSAGAEGTPASSSTCRRANQRNRALSVVFARVFSLYNAVVVGKGPADRGAEQRPLAIIE